LILKTILKVFSNRTTEKETRQETGEALFAAEEHGLALLSSFILADHL
jgi:hypothetical protein